MRDLHPVTIGIICGALAGIWVMVMFINWNVISIASDLDRAVEHLETIAEELEKANQ